MTNRFFLIALLCLTACIGCTQGKYIRKGYAYSRDIIPGVARSVIIEENGTTHKSAVKSSTEYLIYTELPASTVIAVKSIWINGKSYKAGIEPVKSNPVVETNQAIKAARVQDTLVPKTANKIWQVQVKEMNSAAEKMPAGVAKASGRNQVVIEYMYKGRKDYYSIPAIKKLEPVSLQ